MKTKYIILSSLAIAGAISAYSCTAIATSNIGLSIVKNILLGGISKGMDIVKDEKSFASSQLIEQALPSQLQSINKTLKSMGMESLVQKEKQYIAKAASYTAEIAEPILVNGVNSLTSEDLKRIAQGGSGIATQILKEKTEKQLIASITPKIDAKLNEYDLISTINSALKGSSLLGSLLGNSTQTNASNNISQLASEQIVNGLFNIIANYEKSNTDKINQTLGTKVF